MGEEEGSKTAEGGQTAEEQWPGGSMKDGGGWPVAGVGWGETVWSWGGGAGCHRPRVGAVEGRQNGGGGRSLRPAPVAMATEPETYSRCHGDEALGSPWGGPRRLLAALYRDKRQ